MATITKFEDLEIWQLARSLNIKVYKILLLLNAAKHFKLQEQLDDAAGSVMDNISEGFERSGNREFIQFLSISKGSLGEVRSQLYRVFDRSFIEKQEFDTLQKECLILAGKIAMFMSYLNKNDFKGSKFKK